MGALAHEPTTVRGMAIGVPYSVQVIHTSIPRLANCMRGHQAVPPSMGYCINVYVFMYVCKYVVVQTHAYHSYS